MQERLQKLLAQAGYGSRRACEVFITAGRVRVNGAVAVLGQKADLSVDKVMVDGKTLAQTESLTYIALYKPRNVISAAKGQDDRETVRDLIPVEGHLYPVGRLDFDSEGLILMTNDGELTNKLTHPRYGHEKEYRVLVASRPDEKQMDAWRRGVVLEDGDKTAPAEVNFLSTSGKGAWIRVVMGEGKKRQIRDVGRLLGLPVVKIIRLRIGTLKLGSLKPRQWRYLTENEVLELKGDKGKMRETHSEPLRDNRRHPTDHLKQIPNGRVRITDRPKLVPNERSRTKDRTERSRDVSLRNTTKPRIPRR
ncbi:MAG TPA: pseudouridine synthase [Anaerolineales bacterium]|nr:pseudouridine synthase [Anaerolineales bacterium]